MSALHLVTSRVEADFTASLQMKNLVVFVLKHGEKVYIAAKSQAYKHVAV